MIELEQARHRLEELGLGQAAQSLDAKLEAASRSQSTYLSFLIELLDAEIQERQRRNVEVRMKLSHLPFRRTLNEFDFSFQLGIDERLIRELAALTFGIFARVQVLIFRKGTQLNEYRDQRYPV